MGKRVKRHVFMHAQGRGGGGAGGRGGQAVAVAEERGEYGSDG